MLILIILTANLHRRVNVVLHHFECTSVDSKSFVTTSGRTKNVSSQYITDCIDFTGIHSLVKAAGKLGLFNV